MVLRLSIVVAVLVTSGCFRSRNNQDAGNDGGMDATGLDTGEIGRCDPIAGFEQCWPDCRDFLDCPTGTGCSSVGFLCMPRGENSLERGSHESYCRDGQHFLYTDGCFPLDFCRALWRSTRSDRCEYSNGDVVLDGPPPVTCPPAVDQGSPFCGRGCSACGERPFLTTSNGRCTGLTEERAIGVCALSLTCTREEGDWLEIAEGLDYYETPPVCLVERIDDELSDEGFVISLATCRSYQDRHPGEFACVDPRVGWADLEEL